MYINQLNPSPDHTLAIDKKPDSFSVNKFSRINASLSIHNKISPFCIHFVGHVLHLLSAEFWRATIVAFIYWTIRGALYRYEYTRFSLLLCLCLLDKYLQFVTMNTSRYKVINLYIYPCIHIDIIYVCE